MIKIKKCFNELQTLITKNYDNFVSKLKKIEIHI